MMDKTLLRIPRRGGTELRLTVGTFRGQELFQIREWYPLDDGTLAPSKRGIAIRMSELPELTEALQRLVPSSAEERHT